jgi:archaellum biogenesis ATPase FlaH
MYREFLINIIKIIIYNKTAKVFDMVNLIWQLSVIFNDRQYFEIIKGKFDEIEQILIEVLLNVSKTTLKTRDSSLISANLMNFFHSKMKAKGIPEFMVSDIVQHISTPKELSVDEYISELAKTIKDLHLDILKKSSGKDSEEFEAILGVVRGKIKDISKIENSKDSFVFKAGLSPSSISHTLSNVKTITVGMKPIDEWLNGGLKSGRIYLSASDSGDYKSTLALNIGIRAAIMGKNVIYISSENTQDETILRILSIMTDMCYADLEKLNPNLIDNLVSAVFKYFKGCLNCIYKTGNLLSFAFLDSQVQNTIESFGSVDLLILDPLDYWTMAYKKAFGNDNDTNIYQYIMQWFKDGASKNNYAIWATSQITRDAMPENVDSDKEKEKKKKKSQRYISKSKEKVDQSDITLMHEITDLGNGLSKMEFFPLKRRMVGNKTFELYINPKHVRITDSQDGCRKYFVKVLDVMNKVTTNNTEPILELDAKLPTYNIMNEQLNNIIDLVLKKEVILSYDFLSKIDTQMTQELYSMYVENDSIGIITLNTMDQFMARRQIADETLLFGKIIHMIQPELYEDIEQGKIKVI